MFGFICFFYFGFVSISRSLLNSNSKPLHACYISPLYVVCVKPTISLGDLLNLFQLGSRGLYGGHLALVCIKPEIAEKCLLNDESLPKDAGLIGIVSLEDVLEGKLSYRRE